MFGIIKHMKKIAIKFSIALAMFIAIVSPIGFVHAQVAAVPEGATQAQLETLYQSLLQQLVALLMEQLADLRAQLAEVQRVQALPTAPIVQPAAPVIEPIVPIVTAPVVQTPAEAPVLIMDNFYPVITMTGMTTVSVGTEAVIEWSAESLRQETRCNVNRNEEERDRGTYKITPQAPGEYVVTVSCRAIPGNYAGSKKLTIIAQ